MKAIKSLATALVTIIGIVSIDVLAFEVKHQPEFYSRAGYDDNPQVREIEPREVFFTINSIGLETVISDPKYKLSFRPRARVSRYTEETDLNAEDYFFSFRGDRYFEKNSIRLDFNFERESTITTEFTDSGILDVNLPRTTFSASLNWTHFVNEILQISASAFATDVSFEEDPRSPFIDFNVYGVGTSLAYAVSERTSYLAGLNITKFKTPRLGSETHSYTFTVGFQHQFHESTYAVFRIGQNVSSIDFKRQQFQLVSVRPFVLNTILVPETENASGEVVELLVNTRLSRAELQGEWLRSFSPSSQGVRQVTQEVRGFARYGINDRTDGILQISYRQRDQEGDNLDIRLGASEFLNLSLRLSRRFAPEWVGEVGFRFREQVGTNFLANAQADSKRFFISLKWRPGDARFICEMNERCF